MVMGVSPQRISAQGRVADAPHCSGPGDLPPGGFAPGIDDGREAQFVRTPTGASGPANSTSKTAGSRTEFRGLRKPRFDVLATTPSESAGGAGTLER